MFSLDPFRFPLFPIFTFDLVESSSPTTLKNVEDLLYRGDVVGAKKAAENIRYLSEQSDSYRKIAEYHLQHSDLSKAFIAAREISYLSVRDEVYQKICDAHLVNNDLVCAEKIAGQMGYLSSQQHLFTKIFDIKFAQGDLEGAERTALRMNYASNRDASLKKVAQEFLNRGDLKKAKGVLSQLSYTSSVSEVGGRLMDLELKEDDLVSSVRTCALVGTEEAAQKLADKILENKPDRKTINQIEERAAEHLWRFPRLYKIILNALLSLYKALGNHEQVHRLENKINDLDRRIVPHFSETFGKPISLVAGLYTGLAAACLGAPPNVAVGVGAATTLAVRHPAIRRIENVMGIAVSGAATVAGMPPLPAVGMGLGTTFFTRIPLVQSIALGTLRAGAKALGWTAKILPSITGQVVRGVGMGVLNTGEALLGGVGKVIDVADFVLDKWTLRK